MNPNKAEQFFSTLQTSEIERYNDYWNSVKPKTNDDIFRRYLFAFTSVHTTWEGNVRGYEAIKDLSWLEDKDLLLDRLIFSRCGMFNNRTKYIWKFAEQFYSNLDFYCNPKGDWTEYRNELVNSINGLGIAKVSFTLEMCFPLTAEVSCIDTHGIKLYELKQQDFKSKSGIELYQTAEKHWIKKALESNVSSYIARCMFWDGLQNKLDSRYWSYVLES